MTMTCTAPTRDRQAAGGSQRGEGCRRTGPLPEPRAALSTGCTATRLRNSRGKAGPEAPPPPTSAEGGCAPEGSRRPWHCMMLPMSTVGALSAQGRPEDDSLKKKLLWLAFWEPTEGIPCFCDSWVFTSQKAGVPDKP